MEGGLAQSPSLPLSRSKDWLNKITLAYLNYLCLGNKGVIKHL